MTPVILKLNVLAINSRLFNLYKTAKTYNIVKEEKELFSHCAIKRSRLRDVKAKGIHSANCRTESKTTKYQTFCNLLSFRAPIFLS